MRGGAFGLLPILMEQMIFSVPRSGTRTLQEYLNLPGGSYRHFGIHDDEIGDYRGRVHVPLRDPIEVSISWEARGESPDEQVQAMGLMVDYVSTHSVTLHVMESLPNLIGEHPEHEARDRLLALELPRIALLRNWMKLPKWEALWGTHYDLGWLND